MPGERFRVRFVSEQREADLEEPLELALAAARCDVWLEHPCGGQGTCGKCRVRVVEGPAPTTAADTRLIPRAELSEGWRLGCQLTLTDSCAIDVPPQGRAAASKAFGADALPGRIVPQVPAAVAGNGRPALGVAVDLGTTSLAAALVDLTDGRVLATTSRLNPQARFGADIISRIHFAQQRVDGNARLHVALVEAVGEMIGTLASQAGAAADDIVAVTCAGNATMTHSAVGADVTPLGEAPYRGSFVREQELPAAALGWRIHRAAAVRFVPMIGSHVGGDTVAGILATGIDRSDGWRLLIDLGTNAEVVVASRRQVVATSTAAGPAFDGVNISCGMRPEPGAIAAVVVRENGDLVVSTIGDRAAAGLCGSGLVDAVAQLLKAGVVASSGYLRDEAECRAAGVPPTLAARIVASSAAGRAVRLAAGVELGAHDIRQLQLAKGSIAAGISLLLARLSLAPEDLEEILVAGTFGTYLRKDSLLAIGLVPPVAAERVRFVGNAAGAGVRLILADAVSRRRAIDLAARSEYVELAGDPDYEAAFCSGIPFPRDEDE